MKTPKKYIGAHVSVAGGLENAPANAHKINANAFALFTKSPRQWKAPPLSDKAIHLFKENCRRYNFSPDQILAHDGYLINLGHPGKSALKKSREAFIDELDRCFRLGLKTLNFHPGSHLQKTGAQLQSSIKKCLNTISESLNLAFEKTKGVMAVIENTAGQGTNVGVTFEQIAQIIEGIEDKTRVGVCIDTCHAFSAGYDLKSSDGFENTWKQFDEIIGFDYLKGLHLNDSKKAYDSKVDRHESLGKGTLGIKPFQRIMTLSRLDNIPLILETPNPEIWAEEIALLKEFSI